MKGKEREVAPTSSFYFSNNSQITFPFLGFCDPQGPWLTRPPPLVIWELCIGLLCLEHFPLRTRQLVIADSGDMRGITAPAPRFPPLLSQPPSRPQSSLTASPSPSGRNPQLPVHFAIFGVTCPWASRLWEVLPSCTGLQNNIFQRSPFMQHFVITVRSQTLLWI